MTKSNWFIFLAISYFGGILGGEFLVNEGWVLVLLVGVLWVWLIRIFCVEMGGERRWLFAFGLLFLFFGAGRFLYAGVYEEVDVRNYSGYVKVEGCVVEEVDVRVDRVKYVLEVDRVFVDDEWVESSGRILVNGSRYPVYDYRDCLVVSGGLKKPEGIEDFAYDKYLSRYSIYSVVYRARIERVSEGEMGGFFGAIFKLKGVFESRLNRLYTEPYGGFMAGLILGSRRGISDSLMTSFNATGLTHIVAVSGYNVALVVVVICGIFGFLKRRMKVVLSIFFIFVFVILVGASASVVRAGIMGGIALMALFYGRNYQVFIGLIASALIMNLWNPKILVYDVGFQLSFLATLGIVLFSPIVEEKLMWVPSVLGFREALSLTLSAQICVLPIIIINFERLSLISPIANVFVLPFIPLAMLCGFFAVFFGKVIGFLGYLVLKIIIFFVEFFASIEIASIDLQWSFWMGVFYYILLTRYCISRFLKDPLSLE